MEFMGRMGNIDPDDDDEISFMLLEQRTASLPRRIDILEHHVKDGANEAKTMLMGKLQEVEAAIARLATSTAATAAATATAETAKAQARRADY